MSSMDSLEKSLANAFKSTPKLPENGRKMLVEWLPWINVVLGAITLWSAYMLYHWASVADRIVGYANSLSTLYGGTPVMASRWSLGLWLGLIVLAIEGVLYLAAFPGTRDHKKSGWNLLFYGLLLNAAYGIVVLFTSYGGVGSLLGYVLGTAIGLYLLFQIRDSYSDGGKHKA